MPSWAYKRLQRFEEGQKDHPIRISNGTAIRTSKQVTKFLLCTDCEQKFSVCEDYVAKLTELDDGGVLTVMSFLDRERALDPGMAILKNDVDVGKLVYFAASIIWRSAVMYDGDGCKLGIYAENFRRYLLGEDEFPRGASMAMVILEPSEQMPKPYRYFTFPSSKKITSSWMHGFTICGLVFRCFIGGSIDKDVKALGLENDNQVKYVILTAAHEFTDFQEVSAVARSATPRGKLSR